MSVLFNDVLGSHGDNDSNILDALKPLCLQRDQHRRPCTTRTCRRRRPRVTVRRGKSYSPQRLEQIAAPKMRFIEGTLACHHHTLEPERVVRLVKLIHELNVPKQICREAVAIKKRRRRRRRRRGVRVDEETVKRIWLDRQADCTARLVINFIRSKRRFTPNYKQLHVALFLLKKLRLKKRKDLNRITKCEIGFICQQLAVIIDTKCEPYKRMIKVETVKSKGSLASEDKKHCCFILRDFEWESELGSEEESVVTAEGEGEMEEESEFAEEGVLEGAAHSTEPSVMVAPEEESAMRLVEREIESHMVKFGGQPEEELSDYEKMRRLDMNMQMMPYAMSRSKSQMGGESEGEGENLSGLLSLSKKSSRVSKKSSHRSRFGMTDDGEGIEGEESSDRELYEGYEEEEGIGEERVWGEESFAESITPGSKVGVRGEGYVEEEEEYMGIAGEEIIDHPDGTSSYVSWCLYMSWLNEFGKNINLYSNCLKRFRNAVSSDGASKHNEVITTVLENWAKYLGDARAIDNNMVQYFKDKPITKCDKCRDCTIYDYPADHDIPDELLRAIETTKEWKILLAEAEKHCATLEEVPMPEVISIESSETIEILDIVESSSSGFIIEDISRPNC